MTTEISQNEYRQQRLANMQKLQALGWAPFGGRFERTGRLAEVRAAFAEGRTVSIAGRLMTVRDMGKAMFADLRDGSDRFQIYVQKNVLGENPFAAFKCLDLGDTIGVKGELFVTRTGEPTVKVTEWAMLSKSLLPIPEKWHGLKDVEARYRQRYLDLISHPDVRTLFNRRIEMVREIRAFLHERGFQEVETPMMQPQAGGAAAKPFVTHYHALNTEMFLRIAPELYLKRLLVGGFDKIFELNRNFRNEGLSRTHNPEFTMLEIYEAFSDVRGMKALITGLIQHVASRVFGTLAVGPNGSIHLEGEWREATYRDLVAERMGPEWFDLSVTQARARLETEGLTADPEWDHRMLTHEVYEKLVEKTLIQPTFVTRFPAALIPLAKPCADDPTLVDVFELVIGGQEVAPAYSEMNDPVEQRRRFSEQVGHDLEKVDEDFITALEHGMPPAGGMGVGIDRLVMILSGSEVIRDVILFPQLRPRVHE
jgi:lysyl-tRNA synthetase class 2